MVDPEFMVTYTRGVVKALDGKGCWETLSHHTGILVANAKVGLFMIKIRKPLARLSCGRNWIKYNFSQPFLEYWYLKLRLLLDGWLSFIVSVLKTCDLVYVTLCQTKLGKFLWPTCDLISNSLCFSQLYC